MSDAIIIIGLQYGDEGKGSAVDSLTRLTGSTLTVRFSGGCQAGHNVELADGTRHTFSQFGSGTFAGAATHLGSQVVISPEAMKLEADSLHLAMGGKDPMTSLTVDPNCLIATRYHRALNRAREIARGNKRHGSCGMGVGETRSYAIDYGDAAIRASHLSNTQSLYWRLDQLRKHVCEVIGKLLPFDAPFFKQYEHLLVGPCEAMKHLRAVSCPMTVQTTMPHADTVIFEGAQGVLLDEHAGFHPHTTWSEVTDYHARDFIASSRVFRRFCTIGLTKAFTTRHGIGPLPTYKKHLTSALVDPGNPENDWQGELRVGHLDLPLLRYASRACGKIDGLGISWLDHYGESRNVCVSYDKDIDTWIPPTPKKPNLKVQKYRGRLVWNAAPHYELLARDEMLAEVSKIAPIVMTAHGPTHEDRMWKNLPFRSTEEL